MLDQLSLPTEIDPPHRRLESYFDVCDADTMRERIVAKLRATAGADLREREFHCQKLGLPVLVPDAALEVAVDAYIERYAVARAAVEHQLPIQVRKLRRWLASRGIVPRQDPGNARVEFVDWDLQFWMRATPFVYGDKPYLHGLELSSLRSCYDIDENRARIYQEQDSCMHRTLAHELAHAASADVWTGRTGFAQEETGCFWLNEGTTQMIEGLTTHRPGMEKYPSNYLSFAWLTAAFIKEIGVSRAELFRAYFEHGEALARFDAAVEQRFGCGIGELELLQELVGTHPRRMQILRAIHGRDAFAYVSPELLRRDVPALARVLPNLRVYPASSVEAAQRRAELNARLMQGMADQQRPLLTGAPEVSEKLTDEEREEWMRLMGVPGRLPV